MSQLDSVKRVATKGLLFSALLASVGGVVNYGLVKVEEAIPNIHDKDQPRVKSAQEKAQDIKETFNWVALYGATGLTLTALATVAAYKDENAPQLQNG